MNASDWARVRGQRSARADRWRYLGYRNPCLSPLVGFGGGYTHLHKNLCSECWHNTKSKPPWEAYQGRHNSLAFVLSQSADVLIGQIQAMPALAHQFDLV